MQWQRQTSYDNPSSSCGRLDVWSLALNREERGNYITGMLRKKLQQHHDHISMGV